ncbi:MAG: hypothetical protein HY821_04785 [Acidobacteria bacterium]|nr:hypothetical protein [Acidobacteriota bacterium]
MPGFLDNYGVSDARREKGVRRWVLGILGALCLAWLGYWFIHDFREKRQVSHFLDLVAERKFEDAYRLWGCDPKQPCRDYSFQKFLEDWGPKSPYSNTAKAHVRRTRSCSDGVIQILEFGPGDEILLYVDRKTRNLSFSPFSYCVDPAGRNTKFWDIFFR